MNSILKGILKVVEVGAASTVPGGAVVDSAVHAAIDSHGSEASIENAALVGLEEMETLKPEMIADPVTFNAEAQVAHDAIVKMIACIKK